MINYLIAGFIVAYAVLVGYTILIYFNTDTNAVPKRGSKGYPVYMHGLIWFNGLWISFAFALGSIIAKWIGEQLGGM
ncbi:hypothetical protein LCGC14_1126000 [marine sediment metagenome]|uniref:Uncharacterized protein n=1 Tax=marine sediment metagenome TaxID=412755 RepID=A0A0F9Q8D8_9ZZZZ